MKRRSWSNTRKDAAYALAAAAIHAATFAAVLTIKKPESSTPPIDETEVVEIDPNWIDPVEEKPEEPPAPTGPKAPPSAPEKSPASSAAKSTASSNSTASLNSNSTASLNSNSTANSTTPPTAPWTLGGGDPNGLEPTKPHAERAPLSLAQLGVAGPGRRVQGTLAPEVETREHASETALKASITRPMAEYDRDIGLGPEGPVIEDLLKSVYASAINLKGKVTFRVSFDEKGRLVSLYVLSCDGERSAWEELGTQAKSSLAGKEGRHTTEGYESDIEIVTAVKNPSGTDPGAQVSLFGFDLKDGGGPEATKIAILPLKPQLTTLTIGETKVVVPVVLFTVLAMRGDLSDLGATPRRVVHARVVNKPKQWKLPPGIKPNARWELKAADLDNLDRKNQNGGGQFDTRSPRL